MNLKAIPLIVIFLVSIAASSCKKETSDDLQKRADEFKAYLIGKHFVPDEFYASRAIDYDLTDGDPTPSENLNKYILKHLFDDTIVFESNGDLLVDQGDSLYHPPAPEEELHSTFLRHWKIETSKAKNQVLLTYLDYFYKEKRYILDHFNQTEILMHVVWGNEPDTALLFTKLIKK
jgi:hypothetical protein